MKRNIIIILFLVLFFVVSLNFVVFNNTKLQYEVSLDMNKTVPNNSAKTQIGYEWIQTWIENSNSHCYATTIDSLDNIYLAGKTLIRNGNDDTCIVKYNKEGDQIMNLTWSGSSDDDRCYAITVDSLFNIYIVGTMYEKTLTVGTSHYLISQMYLAKFNSSGDYQWHSTWNGVTQWSDSAYGIALDLSNNIYIVGASCKSQFVTDVALIKFNNSGHEQWYRTWGGSKSDKGRGISIDNSGNIYLVGSTISFGSGRQDMCLLKFSTNGQKLWNITWGGVDDEFGSAITLDSSNNIYIAGSTESYGVGGYDMALVKFDHLGNFQWNRTYGEGGSEMATSIICDNSENIYIGGKNDCNMDIVKYNATGDLLLYATWNAERFGESSCDNEEYCYGIEIDSENNIYIAGYIQPQAPAYIFCIKCNSEFKSQWEDYIIFTETIHISDTFTTYKELDPVTKIYRDRTRTIDVSFLIIGFNESVKIDVAPVYSTVKSIEINLKNKENDSIIIYSVTSDKSLIIPSYKDYLFQFSFRYSYSYTSCVRSTDGIFCDEEETKTKTGEIYSDFIDFQSTISEPSIHGYNLIIFIMLVGGTVIILIKKQNK